VSLRVVLDSNIYLSAILFAGVPAALLIAANHGEFRILLSAHILDEVECKLVEKFRRDPFTVRWEIQQLRLLAEMVTPNETIQTCRDPDDNRILECALAGRADVIATGDRDLLTLHPFCNIPILTPPQLLDRISTPSEPLK
jgi:putative PIN family toxin of toxin-antitoxin system